MIYTFSRSQKSVYTFDAIDSSIGSIGAVYFYLRVFSRITDGRDG